MTFIGQPKIIAEVRGITARAAEGDNYNILLSAGTGYGKTYLGLMVVSHVATYQLIIKEDANDVLAAINTYHTRAVFVDEVHTIKNLELLYPTMDSGKYFMLFATNQSYGLPEAFKRRCITLIFEKYNMEELCQIASEHLRGMAVSDACLREIVRASNDTPGNIVTLCIRLMTRFRAQGGFSLQELNDCMVNVFNIEQGLDVRCREYLEILQRVGTVSLDALSYMMGVSRDTLKTEVEPVLLYKGLINITSRGRSLR